MSHIADMPEEIRDQRAYLEAMNAAHDVSVGRDAPTDEYSDLRLHLLLRLIKSWHSRLV